MPSTCTIRIFPIAIWSIRTSGEQRTSNFLPWEAAYAELDFVPELFPDCGREVLWRSIDHYVHRDRRFGGVKK